MRKTLLVIATLFITAQVSAATVTLEVTDIGDGWASIRYSADANVSAFGLKVTADSGATFTDIKDYNEGECTASQKGYGIFPGTIDINEDTGEVDGNGTPVAPDTDPGAEGTGIDTNTLILEMGALYVEGNEPALSGTLIKVKVDGSCWVCVEGEPIRGDIVMTDGTAVEANDCEYIVIGCPVPDVLALDLTGATTDIEAAGLFVGDVAYQCDDFEAADEVLSQDPAGGIVVACGSDVNLVVSTGPAVVPNVVGMADWTAAVAAIEAADLVAAPSGVWHASIAKDEVISQNPTDGGATAPCGSTVDIVVSRGPQPANPMPAGAEYDTQRGQANTYIANVWDPSGWVTGSGYQCIGDAMNNTEITFQNYRVYGSDLTLIASNWKKKAGPWPNGADPRADIDHKSEITFQNYRVYGKDVSRVSCYWKKKDSDFVAGGPCPFTDAQNDAWTCPY